LNACGEDEHEETALEFNDLLCLPGYEQACAVALRKWLDTSAWDEFIVPGCSLSEASRALKHAFGDMRLITTTMPSFSIDLDRIRERGGDLAMSLSGKNRYNIRQSLKTYGTEAPLVLEHAEDAEHARRQLGQLAELHQGAWRARGLKGAFQSPRFVRFHERLIERAFSQGSIQTTVLRVGQQAVGALLCFGWRGTLYFYQCGFRYSTDKRLRPGLATLLLSIQHFLDQGWTAFDLMAGDSEYKRVFANQHRDLQWLLFRRATVRMRVLDTLERLRAASRQGVVPGAAQLRHFLALGVDLRTQP
jgi:CelD/BcsL family acetyltransferase involved in cellulose biosynthesis